MLMKDRIYQTVTAMGIIILFVGCGPKLPQQESTVEETDNLLPTETKTPEEYETAYLPDTEDKIVTEAVSTPVEALTEVFDFLYSGKSWYNMAVLHTENEEKPYYMGERLIALDGTAIVDTAVITEFWNRYPQMSKDQSETEQDNRPDNDQFGQIVKRENRYLEYSGLSANGQAYIFSLHTRVWEDVYSDQYEESVQNYYAYVLESGDIIPMYLYRGLKYEKFNERYGEVTALK